MSDVQDKFDTFEVMYVELTRYGHELADALSEEGYSNESGALQFTMDDALGLIVDQVARILSDDDGCDCRGCTA